MFHAAPATAGGGSDGGGTHCTVLLIDRQPVFLEGLARVMSGIPRVKVVTHASPERLPRLYGLEPDVVVIDPFVTGEMGSRDLEAVKRGWPEARIVVISDRADVGSITCAISLGAYGYLLKSEPIETIKAGLELVCRGGASFSLPVAALMAAAEFRPRAVPSLPAPSGRGLSSRELQVLQMVARGYTDAEIGRLLTISVRTVQRHMTNIFNKLNCRTRSQAVAMTIGKAAPLARGSEPSLSPARRVGDGLPSV